jgi:hypothetical protein
MAKFKDFGTPDFSDAEPISFKLCDEEFTCRPQIPGKTILDLATKTADENASDAGKVVDQFFSTVLVPESLERFNVLCLDPERIVHMETLMDIIQWLVEMYSERPTKRPELSSTGQ